MKKAVIFGLIMLTGGAASAQTSPRGHTTYGGPKTISCLQGGQVVIQIRGVWAVDHSWAFGHNEVTYRMPDGEGRDLKWDSAGMACLIENFGQETVPIVKK